MRARSILVLSLLALSGCTLPTGSSSLTLYRDVFWHARGIDGVMSYDWQYPLELGSYAWEPEEGVVETCRVAGFLRTGAFGWVEEAETGRVVRTTPSGEAGPYELFGLGMVGLCGAADDPAWFFDGYVSVEAIALKGQGLLDIRSIGAGTMMLNHDFVSASEAERWLEIDLADVALADTMNVPLEITVRAWHADGTTLLGEWTRTVVLTYVREEAVYHRGSP